MPVNMEENNGNSALISTLKEWGISCIAGVTGGGLIHLLKHVPRFNGLESSDEKRPHFLTINEFVAGFIPVGYYLASGKIAACASTTGTAIKLISCGLFDAKLHNIPALYIMALNPSWSIGKGPCTATNF
ncbi:MAG: hypothetical protein JJU12_06370 [Chlamydiales bacterium]|nr:hypothetical protein [Chlamydiales bacterium]